MPVEVLELFPVNEYPAQSIATLFAPILMQELPFTEMFCVNVWLPLVFKSLQLDIKNVSLTITVSLTFSVSYPVAAHVMFHVFVPVVL